MKRYMSVLLIITLEMTKVISIFSMVDKKITKSKKGEVHFGVNSLKTFDSATVEDVEDVLKNLGEMRLWRCAVCNDLHIGVGFPKDCPTCHTMDAYVEIDEKEFRSVLKV